MADTYRIKRVTHTNGISGYIQVDFPGRPRAVIIPYEDQEDAEKATALSAEVVDREKAKR